MQGPPHEYNNPEPMQEDDLTHPHRKREHANMTMGEDADMEPPELEQLRQRNRELIQELQNNENERHHAKIEMERYERQWEQERNNLQAQAQAAMQNATAEWQSRLQQAENQAEQSSGTMQMELRKLQHKLDEVHNAAYKAEEAFKQESAAAQAQQCAFARERADLRERK